MDTLKQAWDFVLMAWNAVNLPAGIAMLLSVFVVQTLKGVKELSPAALRAASFLTTIVLFLTYCYIVRIPVRDPVTMGNALIAGVCGPVLVWALKKYTPIDLDNLFVSREDKDGNSPNGG